MIFSKWASQFANSKVDLFPAIPPKEWKHLSLNGVVEELDFLSQVDWACRVLELSSALLADYLHRRARVEEYCLAAEYELAISELDAL